jgi:hypothetical protein
VGYLSICARTLGGLLAEQRFQSGCHFPVASHWDQMNSLERARIANGPNVITSNLDSRVTIRVELRHDVARNGELGHIRRQLASHSRTRKDHDACVHWTIELDREAPVKKIIDRIGDLGEKKVRASLPLRKGPKAGGDAQLEGAG